MILLRLIQNKPSSAYELVQSEMTPQFVCGTEFE